MVARFTALRRFAPAALTYVSGVNIALLVPRLAHWAQLLS